MSAPHTFRIAAHFYWHLLHPFATFFLCPKANLYEPSPWLATAPAAATIKVDRPSRKCPQ